MKKKIGTKIGVVTLLLASSLTFGAIGAGASTQSTNSPITKASASTSSAKSTTGVFILPTNFNKTTVSKKMKTEAVALLKIYADSLRTGKVSAFNTYVDKHVYEKDKPGNIHNEYKVGTKYNKDNYKDQITAIRKKNKKKTLNSYAKALKNVKVSTLQNYRIEKRSSGATFSYSYLPKGWSPMNTQYVTFHFTPLLHSNYYVLETIYF